MSTKKLIIETNENTERYLTEAANILMKGFKTPGRFLSFLTEALYWTSEKELSDGKGTDRTFFIRMLIREVLQPWLKGGSHMIKEIGVGLHELAGNGEYEEYNKGLAIITKGFGISMQGLLYNPEYLDDNLAGIQVMFRVGHCVKLYDKEMDKIKKQEHPLNAA
jgi:hypothetical protein